MDENRVQDDIFVFDSPVKIKEGMRSCLNQRYAIKTIHFLTEIIIRNQKRLNKIFIFFSCFAFYLKITNLLRDLKEINQFRQYLERRKC